MSSVASFHLLHRSAVPGLVEAAGHATVVIPWPKSRWRVVRYFESRFGDPQHLVPAVVSPVYNYLQENDLGVSGGEYGWSGNGLYYLMCFLEDTGTALGTDEYRAETEAINVRYDLTYLVTSADKRHLPALESARTDGAPERYFTARGEDFEEMRPAIDDGLVLLHRLVSALKDSDVLVIGIG